MSEPTKITPYARSAHQDNIIRFMTLADQAVPILPLIPSYEVRRLRAKLILEESLETIKGLGFAVNIKISGDEQAGVDVCIDEEDHGCDIVEVADGCADISVVTVGTLVAFGIKDVPILNAVDENNIAKFGPGGYKRHDGKWLNPPGHKPPDIMELLVQQGYKPKKG